MAASTTPSGTRLLNGVEIDVGSLFAIDFAHLRLTITTILDALNKANERAAQTDQALADAAEKAARTDTALAAANDRARETDAKVDSQGAAIAALESAASDAANKLAQAEKALEAANAQAAERAAKDQATANRIAQLERSVQDLQQRPDAPAPVLAPAPVVTAGHVAEVDSGLAELVRSHGQRLDAIAPHLQQLDVEDAALRSLIEANAAKIALLEQQANDAAMLAAEQADQAAQAYALALAQAQAAALANKDSNGQAAPVVIPVPPLPSHNHDALLLRLKQLATALENLATRVAMLEMRPTPPPVARPASAKAAPVAAPTPAPVVVVQQASSNNIDHTAALDAAQRQAAATTAELRQIQAALAALERGMGDKASTAALALKADAHDVEGLVEQVHQATTGTKALRTEVARLASQLAELQASHAALQGQVQALHEASSCGLCKDARPTVKCAKCALSFCDACDERTHGAECTPEMQAHLRTPLAPLVIQAAPVVAFEPFVPAGPATNRSGAGDDATRRWAEDMFNLLARKEKATRGDIHELFTKDSQLRAQLADLLKAADNDKRSHEEVQAALKKLEADLRALVASTAQTGRNYTDNRLEELLLKLRELERALEKGMRSELKRFERDVLVFLESAQGSHDHGSGDAAVGKIHFRCLSCDQTVGNLQGPASLLYARAVGQAALPINPNATNMNIDRGKELFLSGRDGAVYKGRDPSTVTIAPGDPSRPAKFNVHTGDRMVTTNARGTTINDQKTVSAASAYHAPGGGSAVTPPRGLHAQRPHTASPVTYDGDGNASSGRRLNPNQLPPTRPSTRAGESRRQIAAEEKTPLRGSGEPLPQAF